MPTATAGAHAGPRTARRPWTAADVSGYFAGKISEKTLANWRSLGQGPPYLKIGGAVFYLPDSVERWARGQEQEAGSRAEAA